MLSSNMLLLNPILLIDVTFSTPTPHYAQNRSMSAIAITSVATRGVLMAHRAVESLRGARRISALQRLSALSPRRTRALGQAPAPAPHLCKPLGLSLGLPFFSPRSL